MHVTPLIPLTQHTGARKFAKISDACGAESILAPSKSSGTMRAMRRRLEWLKGLYDLIDARGVTRRIKPSPSHYQEGFAMKTCLLAFGICSMFFVGCVGADDADIDAEDGMIDEAEQALCVSAPTLDAPSTNWSLALSSSGSGDEVSRTSPDASYASSGDNYYTTEITGFPAGGLSNQAVFATHADPPTDSSLCGFAKIEASYTCFDPAQNCWVDCGSSSALGTWTAGNYCLATTGISVPVGYTKVRVKAKATTFVLFGWVAKKVQEGGSWFNNP